MDKQKKLFADAFKINCSKLQFVKVHSNLLTTNFISDRLLSFNRASDSDRGWIYQKTPYLNSIFNTVLLIFGLSLSYVFCSFIKDCFFLFFVLCYYHEKNFFRLVPNRFSKLIVKTVVFFLFSSLLRSFVFFSFCSFVHKSMKLHQLSVFWLLQHNFRFRI